VGLGPSDCSSGEHLTNLLELDPEFRNSAEDLEAGVGKPMFPKQNLL